MPQLSKADLELYDTSFDDVPNGFFNMIGKYE